MEEHDKRSFLLDLMDAAGLGAKDLDGEVGLLPASLKIYLIDIVCKKY